MPPARIALAFGPGRQNKSHTIAKLYFPSAIDDNYRNKTEWLSALREGLIRAVHRHGTDWPFFEAEDPARIGGGSTNKAMAHIAIQEMLGGVRLTGWNLSAKNNTRLNLILSKEVDKMNPWTSDELNKIGNAEELRIATLRQDGTLRRPVIIWVVRVGDELYVRCVNGRAGAWFRGVLSRYEGRIWAGGVEKDVTFVEEEDTNLNDQIDAAYLTKYSRYPQYVAPMVTPEVRAATIKLLPRTT